MTGIELIAQERTRQIEDEGWSGDHDAQHENGALETAAACYAVEDVWSRDAMGLHQRIEVVAGGDDAWPWNDEWDKRKKHDRLRRLVIAGALIAAAIDRALDASNRGGREMSITTEAAVAWCANCHGLMVDHGIDVCRECMPREIRRLRKQLAASEAREKALREALEEGQGVLNDIRNAPGTTLNDYALARRAYEADGHMQQALSSTPEQDDWIGRRTVKSRCPVCDEVIEPVPIKYGVKAMITCPHCATILALAVEDAPSASIGGPKPEAGKGAG